ISLIRKVIIGNDSSIFNGMNFKKYGNRRITELNQDSTEIKQISYNNNTINFTFTAVNYLSYNKYLYKLEGFTDKWSQPTELTQKEYSNLNEGYYTFRIKCVDIYGLESSEATYQFEILPPWYRTTYAYIGYFVLGAALILCLIIIFTLRLKKANIKLERIISERTAEIKDKNFALQLQQSEIVTQNEELRQQSEEITAQRDSIQIQNTELEKLSIVASKTDNSVVIADNEGNIEWVNEGFTRLL
ncbi:MAG: hypothetical protein GY756_05600, partial [bacterium]|nr:hypothetical protein [bacterium]